MPPRRRPRPPAVRIRTTCVAHIERPVLRAGDRRSGRGPDCRHAERGRRRLDDPDRPTNVRRGQAVGTARSTGDRSTRVDAAAAGYPTVCDGRRRDRPGSVGREECSPNRGRAQHIGRGEPTKAPRSGRLVAMPVGGEPSHRPRGDQAACRRGRCALCDAVAVGEIDYARLREEEPTDAERNGHREEQARSVPEERVVDGSHECALIRRRDKRTAVRAAKGLRRRCARPQRTVGPPS